MNEQWQQFLVAQGASLADERVTHFKQNPQAEKNAALTSHILCDLSHYGLIRAYGPEAQSFLQNQFCNDVRNVTPSLSQLNGYCNPKGRTLAFFRIWQREEQYYLRLPMEILAPVLNRLRMFVLRTQVTLEDASDEIIRFGFAGPEAANHLQMIVGEIPNEPEASVQTEHLTIIRIPGQLPRFEIYGPVEACQSLWQQLAGNAQAVGADSWELLDIQAAIPEIYPTTQEDFVPQMINLQAINALSFKKGCYPGQEIVARMHYLGKLKRRMYLAHLDDEMLPAPGDALYAEGSESGQGVGKVVRAQAHPQGGVDLLAVIEIESAENRAIRLKNEQGPLLKLENLPYIVEQRQ